MNIEQRDHLLDLIDNDTHLRGRYISIRNGTPQYCVIGCMMVDAGIDVTAAFLGTNRNKNEGVWCFEGNKVSQHFDISSKELGELQGINDRYPKRKDRQRELKFYVNRIAKC